MTQTVFKKNNGYCPVPPIVHPLGNGWDQPDPHKFLWDKDEVAMSRSDFNRLHTYSCTLPTGVYEGKMWKSVIEGKYFLCFFMDDPNDNRYCIVGKREILIIEE